MLRRLLSPAWAILEYGWYPLLLFLATPYFLKMLGTEKYGNWMLLTATVGLGSMLYAGTGTATIKEISAGLGRADGGNAERTVRASLAIAMLGGSGLAVLILALFWFAGESLFEKMGDRELVRLTGIVAAALIWIEQLDNVFASALKGAERFGPAATIEMAIKTAQIAFAALLVLAWAELWALYAALVIIASLRLIGKAWMVKRLLDLSSLRPSLAHVTAVLHFAKWGWLQGAGAVLFGVADRLLVGSLLGAASLAYYSIASQLALQIHAVSAAGLSVIFPMVSRKLQEDAKFSLWRITTLTVVSNLAVSSALAIGLLLFGGEILTFWLGEEAVGSSAEVLPFLIIAYWLLGINVVPYYTLLGMGRARFIGISTSVSGVVAIVAMYLSVADIGLIGAPLGRGLYAVLTMVLICPLLHHFLQERNARGLQSEPVQ